MNGENYLLPKFGGRERKRERERERERGGKEQPILPFTGIIFFAGCWGETKYCTKVNNIFLVHFSSVTKSKVLDHHDKLLL